MRLKLDKTLDTPTKFYVDLVITSRIYELSGAASLLYLYDGMVLYKLPTLVIITS